MLGPHHRLQMTDQHSTPALSQNARGATVEAQPEKRNGRSAPNDWPGNRRSPFNKKLSYL